MWLKIYCRSQLPTQQTHPRAAAWLFRTESLVQETIAAAGCVFSCRNFPVSWISLSSFGVWSRSIFATTAITPLTPLKKIYQKHFVLCTSTQSEDGSTECFGELKLTGCALGDATLKFRFENSVPQSTNHTDTFQKVYQVHLISIS